MSPNLVALLYLVSGVLFILALRGLSSPDSSRRGNQFGMIGMAIAALTTLGSHPPADPVAWGLVIGGIALGGGGAKGLRAILDRLLATPAVVPQQEAGKVRIAAIAGAA